MGYFLVDLKASGINADQWTTAAQDEGEWRRTVEQGAERFMAKWIAAEKVRAGLRHAVVCPNVTRRTKERITQSKRVCAGSLAIVDKPRISGANLYPPGVSFGLQMPCCLSIATFIIVFKEKSERFQTF